MDLAFKHAFMNHWERFFGLSEPPVTFYRTPDIHAAERIKEGGNHHCLICELAGVRKGKSILFGKDDLRCSGSRRYTGYTTQMKENFSYFLSHGIAGSMEGERYIKTPEMVDQLVAGMDQINSTGLYYVFKRWDNLTEKDNPEVVIFFANPEVLSGLFTLACYDHPGPANAVISPFASGCASIIHFPLIEQQSETPRAVTGMFDPSARHCVDLNTITFAVPMKKFTTMVNNMTESFLITRIWENMKRRIQLSNNRSTDEL